jgi:hypothetical protein
VAWRVNLASAVFATAAVLVLYAIILRLTGRWLPALLAALAFAFSFTFWSQAIVAEVYTLHNLLVAVILWLLLGQPETSEVSGRPPRSAARRWQATFFLVGLSLTNHLTTALLLPAVGLALLWDRPRLRLKDWLIAGGLLLLGLSVYLFIPLRWPALNQGEWMGPRDFFVYISGGQFHGALRLDGRALWLDRAGAGGGGSGGIGGSPPAGAGADRCDLSGLCPLRPRLLRSRHFRLSAPRPHDPGHLDRRRHRLPH